MIGKGILDMYHINTVIPHNMQIWHSGITFCFTLCVYTQNNLSRKYTKCMENTFMRDRCIGNRIVFYVDFKHSQPCIIHIAAWVSAQNYTKAFIFIMFNTNGSKISIHDLI